MHFAILKNTFCLYFFIIHHFILSSRVQRRAWQGFKITTFLAGKMAFNSCLNSGSVGASENLLTCAVRTVKGGV